MAGGKLKETGLSHCISPNVDANNEQVPSALPSGVEVFVDILEIYILLVPGMLQYKRSRIIFNTIEINYLNSQIGIGSTTKSTGKAVRCVKN